MARNILFLAVLSSGAVAAKAGRAQDTRWEPPVPTASEDSNRWAHLRISPRPTDGPNLDLRAIPLLGRDTVGIETCGFFPEDGSPMYCPAGRTCTNIGDYRDCCVGADCTTSSFSSVCLNYNDPGCGAHSPGTTCCDGDANRPYCATYIWSTSATPNRIFTLFNCDDQIFSGQAILDAEPRTRIGSSSGLVATTSATATSSTPAVTTTAVAASAGTSTPVGAIVGGVVGGLAVIGIVVLGIFYMFFRNRRVAAAGRGSYIPAAKTEPDGSNGYESPSSTVMASAAAAAVSFNNVTPHHPPPPAAPPSISPPTASVSPLSGSTVPYSNTQPPDAAADELSKMKASPPVEAVTSPLSKEMPTSPASKEMGISPLAVELPTAQSRRSELPG
ncbi:hypothetical protein QBC47DRAFT_412859 [Echria macrotheca]|uniref:Uncharacterized protein n=1 Tax=Echria macrotheca TaxID=438768 RepID=A0AAJ0BE22_9PEZI|nr:hypothetical protein QBC47DRAFT_412859 [Echria macrotheca]